MSFEWPFLLFGLLLVPLAIAAYLLAQRRRRTYAVRFTNLALLGSVVGKKPDLRRHVPPLLFLLGLAALLVSLARPSAVIAVPRENATVLLMIDVSGSMAADDLKPSRMEAAKSAAEKFVASLPKDVQVGVISFNASARLNAPLGRDHAAATRAIASLTANGGTAIGDGLSLALDQLARRPADPSGQRPPGLVVLLSDGQSTDGSPPSRAAARAQAEGIKVFTVGIGERGAAPRLGGRVVGLDESTLRSIAEQTGGRYFYAAERAELEGIYAALGSQIGWVEERTEVTALFGALSTLLLVAGGLLGLRWTQQFP